MNTKRVEGDEPVEAKPAGKASEGLDPDSMSAPDQERVQQLHAQRAEAQRRGDKQAVKDIDEALRAATEQQ